MLGQVRLRRFKILFLGVLLLFFIQILYFSDDIDTNSLIKKDYNIKTIQLLTERFAFTNWHLEQLGQYPFRNCEEKRCHLVKRGLTIWQYPMTNVDAVMVHGQNLWLMHSRKLFSRPRDQLWVYYSMEPQSFSFCSLHYEPRDLDNWFNITITFKRDSTIVTDYKPFLDWHSLPYNIDYMRNFLADFRHFRSRPASQILIDVIRAKRKQETFVFWMANHCDTASKREDYIGEMLKYVNVDIYGACKSLFDVKHAKSSDCNLDPKSPECAPFLNYKFYLSFENSLCNEYISEKVWKLFYSYNLFNLNSIPVVRGARAKQYEQIVGIPSAYINADDFRTPKDLADYLSYLNENQTAYEALFDWKLKLADKFAAVATEFNLTWETKDSLDASVFSQNKMPNDEYMMCEVCSILHNKSFLRENKKKQWLFSEWLDPDKDCWHKDTKYFLYYEAKLAVFCI